MLSDELAPAWLTQHHGSQKKRTEKEISVHLLFKSSLELTQVNRCPRQPLTEQIIATWGLKELPYKWKKASSESAWVRNGRRSSLEGSSSPSTQVRAQLSRGPSDCVPSLHLQLTDFNLHLSYPQADAQCRSAYSFLVSCACVRV